MLAVQLCSVICSTGICFCVPMKEIYEGFELPYKSKTINSTGRVVVAMPIANYVEVAGWEVKD